RHLGRELGRHVELVADRLQGRTEHLRHVGGEVHLLQGHQEGPRPGSMLKPRSEASPSAYQCASVTDPGRSSIRKIDSTGALSTDRTISLTGVTWVTTTTVCPGYAASTLSRAVRTRRAQASNDSPPGGATEVEASQALSWSGQARCTS